MLTIGEPGVYYDMPPEVYHAQHDWLSWSMMKRLVPPSTPAHLKAAMRAGEERKRHFDLGKVVHRLVLGEGEMFEVVQTKGRDGEWRDADTYQTVSARTHRDSIYTDGRVPILRNELEHAEAMAKSVREHPVASALLSDGAPEVSLFWIDEATGVKCRARLDWLTAHSDGRFIVPDLKTAKSAAPINFQKDAAKFGYYGQQAHYSDGIKATGLHAKPEFVFVVVETADPWLSLVGRFDDDGDRQLAAAVVDRCRRLWRECITSNTWPAYPGGVVDLLLPMWLHYDLEDFTSISPEKEIV